MSQHTPGPWQVDPDPRHLIGGVVFAANATTTIAKVSSSDNTNGTRLANARLIAAAPELLAALEQLGRAIAPFVAVPIGSRNPVVCEAIDAARAAIARAKRDSNG
jgi:hypothetical protein